MKIENMQRSNELLGERCDTQHQISWLESTPATGCFMRVRWGGCGPDVQLDEEASEMTRQQVLAWLRKRLAKIEAEIETL